MLINWQCKANILIKYHFENQFLIHSSKWHSEMLGISFRSCTVSQKKKKKHPYLFQYKLSYRNGTGTNHHGLLLTSVWCFKIFLRGQFTWGSLPNFNFFSVNPQIFQRSRKVHLSNCLKTNFYHIPNIDLRVIRRRNYS